MNSLLNKLFDSAGIDRRMSMEEAMEEANAIKTEEANAIKTEEAIEESGENA